MAPRPELASLLRSLHVPGKPLLLANVWDYKSASLVAQNPRTRAIATASLAIADSQGLSDPTLTLSANITAIRAVIAGMGKSAAKIPLTVDLQDGYQDQLSEAITAIVELGVVGINLEDITAERVLISAEEQVGRIRTTLAVAKKLGVDLVINARTDCMVSGEPIEEAIRRGKLYLEAGAMTVYVWNGPRGLREVEVRRLVEEFDGMINTIFLKHFKDALSVKELSELGVARVSAGPELWVSAVHTVRREIETFLASA